MPWQHGGKPRPGESCPAPTRDRIPQEKPLLSLTSDTSSTLAENPERGQKADRSQAGPRSRTSQIFWLSAGSLPWFWSGCGSSRGSLIRSVTSPRPVRLRCLWLLLSRFPAPGAGAAAGRAARRDAGAILGRSRRQAEPRSPLPLSRVSPRIVPRNCGSVAGAAEAAGLSEPPLPRVPPPPADPTPPAWASVAVSDPSARSASARFVTQKKRGNLGKLGAVSCCRRGVA